MVNLNGSNYQIWKGKMEDLLYVKDYYMPVFNTDKPEDKTDAEWNILHRQVCGYIRQCHPPQISRRKHSGAELHVNITTK